jgi:hypothetical protein
MYAPFCVFCLTVLLCVLLVCECVLDNCHQDYRGTFRLPELRFFRTFSSVARQMPGYNSQRRNTAGTSQLTTFFIFFLMLRVLRPLHSVYCLCVYVYCTAVLCVLFVCICVLYCCIVCTVCVYSLFVNVYCTAVLCVLFVCKCVLYCCIVCTVLLPPCIKKLHLKYINISRSINIQSYPRTY